MITSVASLWRKGNPCTLLVSMKISTAILESSMGVLQKSKDKIIL
jgi:hypothetical protein